MKAQTSGKFQFIWLIAIFVFLKITIQFFIVHPEYQLHRDEYLHLDQGRHLAWGYTSVPPFTSWQSYLILHLGNGDFWVRFFPAAFGAATIMLVMLSVKALKGGSYAMLLAGLALLFSVLLRLNMLYQPNSADVFFFTLIFYLLIRYIRHGKPVTLLSLGIAVGLGVLNKYTVVFLIVALLIILPFTSFRKLFRNKWFYLSGAIAALIILPNALWQIQNGLPVLHHMKELQETQLVNVSRIDFLKEQLMYFIGGLYLLGAGFLSFFTYKTFKPFRPLFLILAVMLAFLLLMRAKPYYAISLYPAFFAFGAVYWEHLFSGDTTRKFRPVFPLLLILGGLPVFSLALPLRSPQAIFNNGNTLKKYGQLRWEDGKDHPLPQDYADMIGWKELAAHATKAWQKIPASGRTSVLVLCDNYGEAGSINYYAPTLGGAVCANTDYPFWYPFEKDIKYVILIKESGETAVGPQEMSHLAKMEYIGRVNNRLAREYDTRVYLLKCSDNYISQLLAARMREALSVFQMR